MSCRSLALVAGARPVALGTGRAAVGIELQAQPRKVVLTCAGEHVDLIPALATRHLAFAHEAAPLESAEQPVGDEGMTVTAGIDHRAAACHPEDAQQVQHGLLALHRAQADVRTPVAPAADVERTVHFDRAKLGTG